MPSFILNRVTGIYLKLKSITPKLHIVCLKYKKAYSYFCSRFVDEILLHISGFMTVRKRLPPNLVLILIPYFL